MTEIVWCPWVRNRWVRREIYTERNQAVLRREDIWGPHALVQVRAGFLNRLSICHVESPDWWWCSWKAMKGWDFIMTFALTALQPYAIKVVLHLYFLFLNIRSLFNLNFKLKYFLHKFIRYVLCKEWKVSPNMNKRDVMSTLSIWFS